jgi:hypothetical protein
MKFKLELPIDKPRSEVWKAFIDPEKLKVWQPSLIKAEPVSGTPGQAGAMSKLTYKENEREFSLTEKITQRHEPSSLHQLYENQFAGNTIKNTFIEQGSHQTLWITETEYKFNTLIMRILGPLMKKNYVARAQKDMERFRKFVESR